MTAATMLMEVPVFMSPSSECMTAIISPAKNNQPAALRMSSRAALRMLLESCGSPTARASSSAPTMLATIAGVPTHTSQPFGRTRC